MKYDHFLRPTFHTQGNLISRCSNWRKRWRLMIKARVSGCIARFDQLKLLIEKGFMVVSSMLLFRKKIGTLASFLK